MKVYNGAVIVWNNVGEGKLFNDIPKADVYFRQQSKANKNPQWERVFSPIFKPNGQLKFGGK